MNTLQRLPISTQSFKQLRRDGDLYVDKTQYIEKLFSLGRIFFLSRPHRFGKSLFLSTLKAYFEGKKELFDGLYIAGREAEIARRQRREPWEASPVLYFDLNARDYVNQDALPNHLLKQLKKLEKKYQVVGEGDVPEERFIYLIETIYETIGKQVVILVDEYDKPLLETVKDEALNEANRSQLKAFYEVIKQCDECIRFAFLTGITKFSKMTLFSGVNNLIDITLLDDYDAICGFTEEELTAYLSPKIEKLAESENTTVEETRARLKKEYDGYCFSEEGVRVYNPYSLLKVLATSKYKYYWFENATPSYLVHYLKRKWIFIPDLDQDVKIGAQVVQDFRYNDHDAIIPLLFQSGYLTIKNTIANATIFQLGYPNEEVRFGFLRELLPLYSSLTRSDIDITVLELYDFLDSGDLAGAIELIKPILAGIIYGNIPNGEEGRPLREQYYQSVLYAVFRLLGVHAQAEVVCATGRIDMLVLTRQHVYIFEFKVNTQGTAQDAIDQIKDREYFRAVSAEGRPVHLVGVSFDEKTRNVGEWKEEVR
ncbi:MAG: ATP-binding protein [Bacteroides sp.]